MKINNTWVKFGHQLSGCVTTIIGENIHVATGTVGVVGRVLEGSPIGSHLMRFL